MQPNFAKCFHLIGANGKRLPFVGSLNHILMGKADIQKTLKVRPRLNNGEDFQLIVYAKEPGKSPVLNMTPTDFEARIYAIRRQLSKVNASLRFRDDSELKYWLQNAYKTACTVFFAERIAALKQNPQFDNQDKLLRAALGSLTAKFADVSFYANREVPIAAPIAAEAAAIGRLTIFNQDMFKPEDPIKMKQIYGPDWDQDQSFGRYDGETDLLHRHERSKTKDGKLSYPDFYIEWAPGIPTPIPNNDGACKRYWAAMERTVPAEESKNQVEATEIYNDESINKCGDEFAAATLAQLSKLLWDSAVAYEMTIYADSTLTSQVDLRVRAAMEMYSNASEWFSCLAFLPYRATYRLEALLDCLVFLMGPQYGKHQLDCVFRVEVL